MRKFIQSLTIFFILASVATFHQNFIIPVEASVQYDLPFPGILPDNPLYFLKSARDHVWVFFTRDNIKKAEVLLNISDRKTAMAQELAKEEKWKLCLDMMEEANASGKDIVEALQLSKKIGTGLPSDFVDEVRLSANKREEIMEDIIAKAPAEFQDSMEMTIQKNVDNINALDKL